MRLGIVLVEDVGGNIRGSVGVDHLGELADDGEGRRSQFFETVGRRQTRSGRIPLSAMRGMGRRRGRDGRWTHHGGR